VVWCQYQGLGETYGLPVPLGLSVKSQQGSGLKGFLQIGLVEQGNCAEMVTAAYTEGDQRALVVQTAQRKALQYGLIKSGFIEVDGVAGFTEIQIVFGEKIEKIANILESMVSEDFFPSGADAGQGGQGRVLIDILVCPSDFSKTG